MNASLVPFQKFFNHGLVHYVAGFRLIPQWMIEDNEHFWHGVQRGKHVVQQCFVGGVFVLLHSILQGGCFR